MPGPLGFVVAFLVFIIVAAIVILGVRWLFSLFSPPPSQNLQLLVMLVLLLFLIVGAFLAPWHTWGFWR
jgi:hypothetical protein